MGPARYDLSGTSLVPLEGESQPLEGSVTLIKRLNLWPLHTCECDSLANANVPLALWRGAGVKMFLTHHYYEGTVSYLPARDIVGTPRDAARCRSG